MFSCIKGWGKQALPSVCGHQGTAKESKGYAPVWWYYTWTWGHPVNPVSDRASVAAWIKADLSTPLLNTSWRQLAGQLLHFFSSLRLPCMCIWNQIQQLFVLDHTLPGRTLLLAESAKQNIIVYWHRWTKWGRKDSTAPPWALCPGAAQRLLERLLWWEVFHHWSWPFLAILPYGSWFGRAPLLLWNLIFFQHSHVNVNSAKWASVRNAGFSDHHGWSS